jgi:hypothetical protein
LWDHYSASQTKKFALGNAMLTLSEERSEELRSKFVESPIKTLPHLSILQDLKPKAISFDSQLANDVAAKNYFPQILELD